MLTTTNVPAASGERPAPRRLRANPGAADQVFRRFLQAAGGAVLVITGAVGTFLLFRSFLALKVQKGKFLTTQQWQPDVHRFGIAAVMSGTVLIALVAILVSTPLAVLTALWISEIAPSFLRRVSIALVNLMFAVPSVVLIVYAGRSSSGFARASSSVTMTERVAPRERRRSFSRKKERQHVQGRRDGGQGDQRGRELQDRSKHGEDEEPEEEAPLLR